MSALFALVAQDHHALMDMFDEAGKYAPVSLIWQSPQCLVGGYFLRSQQQYPVAQYSLSSANVVVAGNTPPDNAELNAQYEQNPFAISRVIHGAHSAFLWDNHTRTLTASRDPLNQHCLYYANIGAVTVVSSEAHFIARLLPNKPALNPAALACWLAGQPNPALCLYEGINTLPLGSSVQISPTGSAIEHTFWDIDPHSELEMNTDEAYRDAFYDLLHSVVGDHISNSDNVIVSQMSGGMDSTSVTAIVQHLLKPEQQCRALSHLYSHSQSCDESDNIKAMYEKLELVDPIQVTVDAGAHRDFLSLYPTDFDSPGTVLSPRYHQECELIKGAGSSKLLTGNGGDEMCWGHASAYTQRFKQGELSVVREVLEASKLTGLKPWPVMRSLFIKPLIPEMLINLARKIKHSAPSELPAWLTANATKLATDSSDVENPFNERKAPVSFARYHALKTTSTYNAVRSYQKVAWQYGIEVAHPFFDRRIAEFSFAIPPKQLIRGPYPKWLLRNAMQNDLPDRVCWNVNKVTFDNHFGQLVRDNAKPLRELLCDTRLEEMGLVNNRVLLEAFDKAISGQVAYVHVDLLYAILTQRWIQQHHS